LTFYLQLHVNILFNNGYIILNLKVIFRVLDIFKISRPIVTLQHSTDTGLEISGVASQFAAQFLQIAIQNFICVAVTAMHKILR